MLARCSSLTRRFGDCSRRLGLARGISRTGLVKRHRSQTRVNRSCALQDHSFRHTAACLLLCPGWSHCGFCSARADSQGWTPGSCLALFFASTPSVNKRSTLASPFCLCFRVARSVLRGCRDVVAGLLLTLSCALLLAVLAARLDVAWLLVLGVRAYADPGLHGSKP